MFSKKNKYRKYVHVYIICTNTRFTFLCFSCKCRVCICISVQPGKLQYRAVQVSPASGRCSSSVHRHPERALSARGAQLQLPAQSFPLLCLSPAGFGCRELLRCARGAASPLGTPVGSLQGGNVCRSCCPTEEVMELKY